MCGCSRIPRQSGPAEGALITAPDSTVVGSSLIGVDPVPTPPLVVLGEPGIDVTELVLAVAATGAGG